VLGCETSATSPNEQETRSAKEHFRPSGGQFAAVVWPGDPMAHRITNALRRTRSARETDWEGIIHPPMIGAERRKRGSRQGGRGPLRNGALPVCGWQKRFLFVGRVHLSSAAPLIDDQRGRRDGGTATDHRSSDDHKHLEAKYPGPHGEVNNSCT